ncbi:MAG: hypothetical protein IPI32_03845 [Austwickia sp.]|jgi:hypothetical protein|nr:hypothetical protein [Austwickia sp.]MBK8436764.1 hypothetical protein [Austwickia sp.]MBK9100394.1 hypothetical protein [Austwickia sp.]
MRKTTTVLAVPVLSVSLLLAGCGGSSKTATSTNTVAAGSTATAAADPQDLTSQCPADNTQAFPKARFVTNLALGSGAFYQWLYKPYKAGKFEKGASGRTMTMIKAGLAGAFAAKQLKDATNNVKADPTLCKAFITPLTKLSNTLEGLKGNITSGDFGAIAGAGTAMDQLLSTAKSKGIEVTPQENVKL